MVKSAQWMGLCVVAVVVAGLSEALAAESLLLNADGKVWVNGRHDSGLSTRAKIVATDLHGSKVMRAVPVLNEKGDLYVGGQPASPGIPFKMASVAIQVVGRELYVLDGAKGEVWRYFRQGPGKGEWKQEPSKAMPHAGPCVDLAVVGPDADRVDRTVYILAANSKVFVDGKENPSLYPRTRLVKPTAIAVEDGTVYLLDGANGKVYKNGTHAPALSTHVFVPCVDLAIKNGKSYILTPDGVVYVNGERDAEASSRLKSKFVAIYVR